MKLFEVQDLEELAGRVDAGGWSVRRFLVLRVQLTLHYMAQDGKNSEEEEECEEAVL